MRCLKSALCTGTCQERNEEVIELCCESRECCDGLNMWQECMLTIGIKDEYV